MQIYFVMSKKSITFAANLKHSRPSLTDVKHEGTGLNSVKK